MSEVKYVPPHPRVVKEEPRKKEELKKKKVKKNQRSCCIRQDKGTKAACEEQKVE
jgi:hypothetical protein